MNTNILKKNLIEEYTKEGWNILENYEGYYIIPSQILSIFTGTNETNIQEYCNQAWNGILLPKSDKIISYKEFELYYSNYVLCELFELEEKLSNDSNNTLTSMDIAKKLAMIIKTIFKEMENDFNKVTSNYEELINKLITSIDTECKKITK